MELALFCVLIVKLLNYYNYRKSKENEKCVKNCICYYNKPKEIVHHISSIYSERW